MAHIFLVIAAVRGGGIDVGLSTALAQQFNENDCRGA
jgi:hypothetical protein